jgi:single-stranded-DNA-specific exonuclease
LKTSTGNNPSDLLLPEIDIDAEINFADITPKLTRILKQFEPFAR